MFSRHSLFLTLFVSLLVFTSAFIRGYIEDRGRKLGRLGRQEAIKASLIRDLLHGEGVMIKDEKKMDGMEEMEMVEGEVKEELMGKEVMMGELEEQQTENEEEFVNIKDSYDPYTNGENKDGWIKKKEERKTMMGTGTETPPSTIPYMPLRMHSYPPLLNVKQDFRWPVVEVEVEDGGSVDVRMWNADDIPSKKFDTRPFSRRAPLSHTGERGVGECGGEFRDLSGIVTSPDYPYNYPNAITCIYQIMVPSQYTVGLDCNDVSIQPGDKQCENDYLLVYDGHHPDGIRYCGDKALGIFSSGSNITLIFTSDQSYRYRGFMCRYRALRPDGTGAEGTIITNTTDEDHTVLCTGPGDAGWSGKCGVTNGQTSRVVGGGIVGFHQYPWMVAVLKICGRKQEMYCHICGGTVINTEWVLTGAHCLVSQAVEHLAVLLGDHNLYTLTPSQKFLKVDKVYVHPDFNVPKPLSNDVALMHFPQEIAFNAYVAPICMPPKTYEEFIDILPDSNPESSTSSAPTTSTNSPPIRISREIGEAEIIKIIHEYLNGRNASVYGWGIINDNGDPAQQLRGVEVTILPNSECEHFYGDVVRDTMLCTSGQGGRGPCGGDSGSPAQLKMKDGRWCQVGVLAFGAKADCSDGYPSGNVLLPIYMDWIEYITGFDFNEYY